MSVTTIGLRFRILEPMMFRKPGEFDPASRGVYSSALSFSLPTPSTFAGAIATLILTQNPNISPSGSTWEDEYRSVLGNAEFRGPYLLKNGDLFVAHGEKGFRLWDLPELVKSYWSMIRMRRETYDEVKKWMMQSEALDKQLKDRLHALGKFQERTSVGLMKRTIGIKVADEERGLLYTSSYIDYTTSIKDVGRAEICIDAKNIQFELKDWKAIRLGGEGRISVLLKGEGTIFNSIKDQIWEKSIVRGPTALYLASPALFKCRLYKDLIEVIREKLNKLSKVNFINIVGSTAILGAGFSLSRGRRKPIYLALEPGSIVLTDFQENCSLEEIYWHSLSEVGGQAGYGTVVPVPLT
ncbi:MAG: type III-B CRISPR module-associated Cmr3 family protein [Thermoproteota archaeon]